MSYYKKPEEMCTCGTGIDRLCAAHEERRSEKRKKHFLWGTAILVALLFVLFALGALYGGFDPLSFPGDFGY